MNATFPLLLAAALGAPQVEVSTLDGDQHAGMLQALSAKSLTVMSGEAAVEVPADRLLEVRFVQTPAPPADEAKTPHVRLVDGSQLTCTTLHANAQNGVLVTADLGGFTVPLAQLSSIRFGELNPETEAAWSELLERELTRDRLVILKGAVLDHLDGVVGEITDEALKFLVDGQEVSVKRNEKLFGVIYARKSGAHKPACELSLASADRVQAKSVTWTGEKFDVELLAGARVSLDPARVQSLDYSLGKIRYLSQMEPRDVEYTPFLGTTWDYLRDRNQDGQPISVGGKVYPRGLWIHSETTLVYRLGKQFRRFQAVMGIEDLIAQSPIFPANSPRGHVHVIIKADDKVLLETDVQGTEDPRPLDLDVSGVRELEIMVGLGSDLDIGDHLVLADAKVIK